MTCSRATFMQEISQSVLRSTAFRADEEPCPRSHQQEVGAKYPAQSAVESFHAHSNALLFRPGQGRPGAGVSRLPSWKARLKAMRNNIERTPRTPDVSGEFFFDNECCGVRGEEIERRRELGNGQIA